MARGKRAFEGKNTASVIAAVLERNPQAISTLQPASPPALDRDQPAPAPTTSSCTDCRAHQPLSQTARKTGGCRPINQKEVERRLGVREEKAAPDSGFSARAQGSFNSRA
jgi:hypothetical protein